MTFAAGGGTFDSNDDVTEGTFVNSCSAGESAFRRGDDGDLTAIDAETEEIVEAIVTANASDIVCGNWFDEEKGDSGPGGRLSYVSLSGGFGTVSLGQVWSASANHYGFAVDHSYAYGVFWRCQLSTRKYNFLCVKCWRCEFSNR